MNRIVIAAFARNLFLPLIAGALLAGCGGSGSGLYGNPRPMQSPPPLNGTLGTAQLNGALGFVNSANHTVYVFDADLASPGHSTCSGGCAQNWPPVLAAAGTMLPSPWSKITRSDGGMQLVYKGRPLYAFAFDVNPGDANGDGVNAFGGLWHIARP